MTKNILEWGWHTSAPTSSAASDWKPATTLLGGADSNIELAAAGDLKCQGVCSKGGSYGTTGAYSIDGRIMCRDCAVKARKIGTLLGAQQNEILKPDELQ